MTCYKILTGKILLDEYFLSHYVVVLCEKKKLELPILKDLISRHWHQDCKCRPTSTEIVLELKKFIEAVELAGLYPHFYLFAMDEGRVSP